MTTSAPSARDQETATTEAVSLPWLLTETTLIQALGTAAVLTVPALAPAVAVTLGVPSSFVGYQVGLVYLAAMVSSLVGGALVARWGPCRTGQTAMALAAGGSLLVSIPHLGGMVAGSLAIGFAYGLINPSASDLLQRHSPPHRRNLLFSVKQTGVPIGGILAGLVGAPMAVALGWSAVLWAVAAACLVLMFALQRGRAKLDAHANASTRLLRSSILGLETIRSDRSLLLLAASSFCFSAIQLCLVAFLVVLLVEDLQLGLVEAGMILAAVQVMGAVGRLLWGYVADRIRSGLAVLTGLAALMAVMSVVILFVSPDWPLWTVIVAFMGLGLTGVGWNGVYLSEVARLSPLRAVGSVTGTAMFVTFAGVLVGPTIFSFVHARIGSYIGSYGVLTVLALVGGALAAATWIRDRRSTAAAGAD
ncbi:MFS transporter [Aurantimonas sp. A2-1-M11]|uniref:MFS transporter n=1 Tax=Aurantimonas sp. A2-1-M11 TaxID=3113712 RepID=UPI002F93EC7D